jgi:hypothetical protein
VPLFKQVLCCSGCTVLPLLQHRHQAAHLCEASCKSTSPIVNYSICVA